MMDRLSKVDTNGSCSSVASAGSVDDSSHHHILNHFRSIASLPSWLHESWAPHNHRHERIAAGALSSGIGIVAWEELEDHIRQAPDICGMIDILPVANSSNLSFVGGRKKLCTWPLATKHKAMMTKKFDA